MTKSELSEAVRKQHPSLSGKQADAVVSAVFAAMTEAFTRGDRIELRGFGMFTVKERPAREGRNPHTGEAVSVMAKRAPSFKAGLRERVQ